MGKERERFVPGLRAHAARQDVHVELVEGLQLPDGFALHVPRAPEVCRDVSASALAFVMPSCQLDDGAVDMEVVIMDAVVLARDDLDFGPRDGFLSVISGSSFDHFRRRAAPLYGDVRLIHSQV